MENLSFFQADLETKELGCFGETGCKALKGSLSMCNKSSVISEEEVSDQLLLGLCVGLKSPEIEEVAIEAIADINAIIVIEVFSSLSQHHAEEDGEESRCQDAALFHAVADCERLGEVTVEPDLATLVDDLHDLHDDLHDLHDLPHSFSAHCVECFGQVDEGNV